MWPANDKVYNDCGRVLVQPLVPLRRFDKYPAATAALAVARVETSPGTETRFQFLSDVDQATRQHGAIYFALFTISAKERHYGSEQFNMIF